VEVYRSTNQGGTWEQVLTAQGVNSGNITEIIRTDRGVFYAAISADGVYRSPNGNINSWIKIADATHFGASLGRIVLNFAPSDNNIIYALYTGAALSCNDQNSNIHLRRWDDSSNGGEWTGNYDGAISLCADVNLQLDPQGGYNLCVAARPNNANEIFIGGERLYRFTISGASTGTYVFAGGDQGNPTATNIHVDHHYLLFSDNNTLWSTNDGGMRSTDVSATPGVNSGFNWDNKNQGLITYQFYRGDISPTTGSDLVGGGAQDNANNLIPAGTTNGTELGGGDGVQFALIGGTGLTDYNAIISTQNGNTNRTSANSTDYISPDGSTQGFLTFFVLDGDNTEHLYYPSYNQNSQPDKAELFRTRTLSSVTTSVTGNPASSWQKMTLTGIGDSEEITAMGLSRNKTYGNAAYSGSNASRKLYIGTNSGAVYRVSDPAYVASYNLTNITPNGANGYISDIAVNPNDDKEIVVTLSNYNVSSIYHTTDATAGTVIWTQIEGAATGAVAKASIRSAMITTAGASIVYLVGTSTGLYCATILNGISTSWEQVSPSEIAFALCVDMRLRTADNKIGLATHGNGMYILSPEVSNSNCDITAISAGNQSVCDSGTNTFTQVVTVTFNDAPASGNLVVNGQNFALGTSPQTVTLIGLPANGQAINTVASFSIESTCNFTQSAAFTAPTSCSSAPSCTSFFSTGSVIIPDSGVVTSIIVVAVSGTITDVNIKNLQGTHAWLGDLTFELTSPAGTKITLFSALCNDNAEGFNISLDDAADAVIMCPLNDNQTEMPSGDLSDFNGQEAIGNWILTITDAETPDGGELTSWTLELCGNFGSGLDCNSPPPASGNIAAAIYQNNGTITTGGSISSPNVVLFKAKDCISLTDGFSVADGAALDCIIEDCPTSLREDGVSVVRIRSTPYKGK
jgi:subtilisin-like proprotein convertase family protein